ncbi:polyamine aminopropyltransferase [Castellaniella sp. GW247-6E4]|uniref:polyamine aminopropyltransferase n=1 Tax=Castellaniella sp. GW247-6E4 TaxID=3140380 RepID=UPI003315CC3C
MHGLHLTADLYHCDCDGLLMTDAEALAGLCRDATLAAGLTIVGEKWHVFPDYQGEPGGVTGTLLLAESHLAVHTWPERRGVTLDVYVCNFEADNSDKAERLMSALEESFRARESQRQHIMRGDRDGPVRTGDELLLESLNDTSVYGFRFARRILDQRTDYQHLELLESDELGLALRLDGSLMTSEADEFFYHEALIHPAAIAHPDPQRVLIVGGGDGGALEELLKHPSVRQATLVELDGGVVEVARQHLGRIHRGSLDDPRATVRIGDGAAFVRDTTERYDLVYLDLTDPETPAGPLYTEEFFAQCRRILAPGGALVLHLGSPFHEPRQVEGLAGALARTFAQVRGYGLHIPLYGSYWSLAVASDTLDPVALAADEAAARLEARGIDDLQYYNAGVHGALFALPNFYQRLMPQEADALALA